MAKTAVSIPDELFERAERTAARLGWNRSQLYARALDSFLVTEDDDPVTEALDRIADAVPDSTQGFNAGRELIRQGRWEW